MKIERITVRAGRCVPHPLHSYGNLKADLELVASLDGDDDAETVQAELQSKAESDIEQHMADLREGIHDMQAMASTKRRVLALEAELKTRTDELEKLSEELHETFPLFTKKVTPISTTREAGA